MIFRKPPSFFICRKCSNVLENCVILPDSTKCCFGCAQNSNNTKDCILDQKMNALVENLEVTCKNKRLSCNWKGPLHSLKEHLKQCEMKLLQCTHCNHLYPKSKKEEHEKHCIACESCKKNSENKSKTQLQIDEQKKEIERLNKEIVSLKKQISPNISKQFENFKTEIFNLQIENKTLKESEKKLLYEIYIMNEENTKLKGDNNLSLIQINNLRNQILEFKSLLEVTIKNSSNEKLNPIQMNIINQIEEISEEKDKLAKRIDELTNENEKLKKECILLVTKNSNFNKQLVNELEKYKDQAEIYKKTIEFLKQEITKLKSSDQNEKKQEEEDFSWKVHQADLISPKFSSTFTQIGHSFKLQLTTSKKSIGFLIYPKGLKSNVKAEVNLTIKTEEGPLEKKESFIFTSDDSEGFGWQSLIKKTDLKKLFKENPIFVNVKLKALDK